MKIVSANEMARIEKLAYASGSKEEDFVERSGKAVADQTRQFVGKHHIDPHILLLLGSGNNAADGLAAATLLKEGGFDVFAVALAAEGKGSPLYLHHLKRFTSKKGKVEFVKQAEQIPFQKANLIIDAIFGTGFHGEVEGLYKEAILRANQSGLPIIAVDIPSGVNGNTGEVSHTSIKATATCFLGLPKTGCFLGDVWNLMGEVSCWDFGLPSQFVEEAKPDFYLIDNEMIITRLPPIKRTRHKYQAGLVIAIAGSPSMPGAALLACKAALRSGAGMVRLFHPKGMEVELSSAPYELIRQGYEEIETILRGLEKASALFVGPGMGNTENVRAFLQKLFTSPLPPCVIDADALNVISQYDLPLPPKAILTPHVGEAKRLLKIEGEVDIQTLLMRCREYSEKKKVTLLLKGALTYIFHPGVTPHISARGDPGMATAGSGDVLTGVIAALLAQTKNPFHAALLGASIHAMAGELAAQKESSFSMIASDIIDNLHVVYTNLQKQIALPGAKF